ncbi:MAG: FkbM family methyltransferase, partial [Rhizobiales bacterium]|nr:FkbM family methyltransferase [Hyphomicrobiales bacterium]
EHVAVVNRLAVLEDEMERMTAALALGGSPADTVPPPSEPGPAQATAGHPSLSLHVLDEGLFVLKTGDLISETAIRTGHWDPHILRAADRVAALRPEGRGVDAGAQFGLLTVPLARRFARVTSFEPNRYSASLLVANVALNGLSDRVAICRDALFSRATQLSLAQPSRQEIPLSVTPEGQFDPAATSNIGAYSFAERGTQIYESNAVALDSLALDDVAFLKIDVQGADGEVVMGALATIERCRPWVAFEWEEALSRNFGTSLAQVIQAMEARGYRVAVLHRHNEKQADYLAFPSEQSGHTAGLLPDAA